MTKVIILLFVSVNVFSQINVVKDTTVSIHSKRYPLEGGELLVRNYILPAADSSLSGRELRESKYFGILEPGSTLELNGKAIDQQDIVQIESEQLFSFIFPFSFYKMDLESLFDKGISVVGKSGKFINYSSKPKIIVNFYNRHRACHFVEIDGSIVSGKVFKQIHDISPYDRIEVVLPNQLGDNLRMNFILSEY